MGNFFNNLGARFQQFMVGRNGPDRLGTWALGVAVVTAIVNIFLPNIVCSILSYAFLFYAVYRMFSSNVAARRQENDKFEALLAKVTGHGNGKGSSKGAGPTKSTSGGKASKGASRGKASKGDPSKFEFKCEQCGQSLSVPKGRGTLKVTCPKCHHQQKVKS